MTELPPDQQPPPGRYDPRSQDRSVIAIPLLEQIRDAQTKADDSPIPVVIDINLDFKPDRRTAVDIARKLLSQAVAEAGQPGVEQGPNHPGTGGPYLLARLQPDVIVAAARLNTLMGKPIFRIWPDFEVHALLDKSISTVKADAAHAAYAAVGKNIIWAVLDTGVQADHRHFHEFGNLHTAELPHLDFTEAGGRADVDANGHGTHVAGIIAGRNHGTSKHPLLAVRMTARRGRGGLRRPQPADRPSPASPRSARSSATRSSTTTASAAPAPSSPRWTRSRRSTTTAAGCASTAST